MKKLIVHADDFGLSPEVNEGIIRAISEGIVTSTSLMASGEDFLGAVEFIRMNPHLDIGAHLTLIAEKSVLPREIIPSLVNESGRFRSSSYRFLTDYLKKKISLTDVKKELRAQIEKILDQKIVISHIDSHQHIHVLPKILEIVTGLADEFKINYIRNPREKFSFSNIFQGMRPNRMLMQIGLNLFCLYSRKKLMRYSIENFFGFYHAGRLSKRNLMHILKKQTNGISELMCHPALHSDGSTREKYSHWKYNWAEELSCLTDEEIISFLEEEKIELLSFSDLNKFSPSSKIPTRK